MDKELVEELSLLPKNHRNKDNLEDYIFIANCLQVGITIQDLKEMQYVDVAKILLCFNENREKRKKEEASQEEINKLLG